MLHRFSAVPGTFQYRNADLYIPYSRNADSCRNADLYCEYTSLSSNLHLYLYLETHRSVTVGMYLRGPLCKSLYNPITRLLLLTSYIGVLRM